MHSAQSITTGGLHMSEQMSKEKKWEQCTGGAIAWLGLDIDMDIKEIADWLDALVESGGCGFGSGDAFGDSSNSLATWVSSLAEKIRRTDSSRPRRNCDVGAVEEQEKRWRCNCGPGIPRCCKCAVYAEAKKLGLVKNRYLMSCDCKFIWAQMPYEEADGEIK